MAIQSYASTGAITLGPYEGLLRDLVLKTKRQQTEAAALATADLLVEYRRKELDTLTFDFVVPIPMHWFVRCLWRGVNGAGTLHCHANCPQTWANRFGMVWCDAATPVRKRICRRASGSKMSATHSV